MRQFWLKTFLLLFVSTLAWGTATVTGHVSTPSTGIASGTNFVTFDLQGCGNNPAHATQGGEQGTLTQRARFPIDATGNIKAADGVSAAAIVRNDQISCGGQTSSTFYLVTIYINNSPIPGQPQKYRITSSTFVLDTALPLTVNPVVPAPTGDTTYVRLDGANRPAKNVGPTLYADWFTGTDIGSQINACLVALPATGGTCDASAITGTVSNATNPVGGLSGKPFTLILGQTVINDSSCWVFTNDGASPPSQGNIRILGAGYDASSVTAGKTPVFGTIINNSCNTGVAKFDTRGKSTMEIAGITFQDSSGDSLPFWQTTNTILLFHNNQCYGSKNGTANNQDCIVLGSTTMNIDGSSTAAFQGYGTYIQHNFFNHIRRAVYGQTFVNDVPVTQNIIWAQAGSNLTGGAAIEFSAIGGQTNVGNQVRDNLIEVTNYPYGIKFSLNGYNNTISGNGCFDPTGTHLACTRFENLSEFNLVEDGFRNDTYGGISEDGGSFGTNTFITAHQSQTSTMPQFFNFTGNIKFTGASLAPAFNVKLSSNNDEYWWGASAAGQSSLGLWLYPAGGTGEPLVTFRRYDTNQRGVYLNASTTGYFEGAADIRVRAAGGSSLWLGTNSTPDGILLQDSLVRVNNPVTFKTDNVFDIGASGASRPRDFFLGRNATVAGQLYANGNVVFLASAFTTDGTTNMQPVTGLQWVLPANTALNLPFSCSLLYHVNNAGASVTFGVQASVAPTNMVASGGIQTSTGGTEAWSLVEAITTTAATAIMTGGGGAIITDYTAHITGFIENPSQAANTLSIQVKTSVGANTVTVQRDSRCVLGS